jgi:DNA polymerase V
VRYKDVMGIMMLPLMQPVPLVDVPEGTILRIVGAAGAGFPSPAQDWEDDAISLIELLRLDRPASFVFRISGSSMIEAGIHDNDVVVVDRDMRPTEGHIVIAIVDGGFVCRQLVHRRGAAFLEARNSQQRYEATLADGVEIWGVVRTGVRDYRR